MIDEVISTNLPLFRVQLSISGLTEAESLKALPELQELLEMRRYLQNIRLKWNESIAKLEVVFELQAMNERLAEVNAYENLFESIAPTIDVLPETGIEISVLSVEKL